MVIHDQMGVTCAIVVQSATQKLVFKNWGETLAMDWTHGTNNVGYHLGRLVATMPTGRGFPVLDFMSLNEKAVTLENFFDFFKSKNALWMKIKTFVIDKHFVEWRVLEECFPTAKVLLCQFHAIMYWKKLVSNRFGLVVAEQDTVQRYFAKMLYSKSLSAFERTYKQFCSFCAGRYPNVRSYFDKNWKECRKMWSNHLRNKYFSAGNTTTNRIESNWHLLKQLLGKKTSVDQTVASVLTHQATITRQVLQTLHRHNCSSRNPDSVPVYLRRTAGDGSFERRQDNQWMWDVTTNGKRYACNDIEWTCTCPFWTSLMLPCQHLMYVCRYGHGFEELPIMTILSRWSMAEATKLFRQIEKNASSIDTVTSTIRLRNSARWRAMSAATLSSTSNVNHTKIAFGSKARVAYLNHLQSLSGTGFYKALEKWEDFVAGAVKNTDKVSDTSDTDEDNYDVDITDYYDAVQLVEEMEKMQYEEEKEEEDICPPTQPSTVVTLTQSATLTEQATLTETAANSAKAPTTPPLPATLSATATLPASVEPGAAQGVH
ncbi:hypothetical protein F441_09121, partial [Phytophthora nicotianae CJ01A1]